MLDTASRVNFGTNDVVIEEKLAQSNASYANGEVERDMDHIVEESMREMKLIHRKLDEVLKVTQKLVRSVSKNNRSHDFKWMRGRLFEDEKEVVNYNGKQKGYHQEEFNNFNSQQGKRQDFPTNPSRTNFNTNFQEGVMHQEEFFQRKPQTPLSIKR